jgi:soluble lytic murein transglycosylase
MNSPFQLESPSFVKQSAARIEPKVSKAPLWWGVLVALLSSVVIAWTSGQIPGMPSPLQNAMILPVGDKIYAAQPGATTQAEARQRYRRALLDLKNGNPAAALTAFKELEAVYPGLQDFLWLHEAEGYAVQGNEWATQKKLQMLISQHPESLLVATAQYRIGQSQIRGGEWEKAQKTFSRIRQASPKSPYAVGALYYLGVAAYQEGKQSEATAFLKDYLSQCPDCKFSGEGVDLLNKMLPKPTREENTLIGLAESAAGKDLEKTIYHLSQGEPEKTWLALGKTLIRAGKKREGLQILTAHLANARDLDMFREALDLILANTDSDRGKLLRTLQEKRFPVGQDYLLWKLAEAEPDKAQSVYQTILDQYPDSDYAPESGWNLLWPLLSSGNQSVYLAKAQQYLVRYPYARSAPKALFWTGKLLEKSSPVTARATYQNLLKQYPTNYYAFRAKGRLNALSGKADPGWPTFPRRQDYPTAPLDLGELDILPPASKFAMGTQGRRLREIGRELMAIGAVEDVKLLLNEAIGSVPPAVASWAEQLAGDRVKGLRIIRDALDKQFKEAYIASGGKRIQPVGSQDELKLLYPLYFNDLIAQAGRKNALDPFLIQSLMREESYFNEFAISGSNARGLMQLLPSTAKDVANWETLPGFQTGDLFTPAINIRLGSRYLGFLHQQFNGNSMPAVGAYNGGPNAMKRWVQSLGCFQSDPDLFVEKIPYEQSRDYIKKVFTSYWNYTRLYATPAM